MTEEKKTPIALFVYNRPEHARLVLETLAQCDRFNECSLRIYCDGPKDGNDREVSAARQVAREWADRSGGEVVERETNLGLARSIVTGVTELCESHGRVIVLEDDFALHPSFLDYMLRALDRYADDPNVYQISGYMYPIKHAPKPDAFFLPLTTTWGWATWHRAWQSIDWKATGAGKKLSDPEVRRRFDLDGTYPYSEMLAQTLAKQNESWGILFWWAVFQAGGFVLHPRNSLVWHGGFDGSGVHCGPDSAAPQPSLKKFTRTRLSSQITMPEKIIADEAAFDRIKAYLRAQRRGSLLTSVRQRLGRLFPASAVR